MEVYETATWLIFQLPYPSSSDRDRRTILRGAGWLMKSKEGNIAGTTSIQSCKPHSRQKLFCKRTASVFSHTHTHLHIHILSAHLLRASNWGCISWAGRGQVSGSSEFVPSFEHSYSYIIFISHVQRITLQHNPSRHRFSLVGWQLGAREWYHIHNRRWNIRSSANSLVATETTPTNCRFWNSLQQRGVWCSHKRYGLTP